MSNAFPEICIESSVATSFVIWSDVRLYSVSLEKVREVRFETLLFFFGRNFESKNLDSLKSINKHFSVALKIYTDFFLKFIFVLHVIKNLLHASKKKTREICPHFFVFNSYFWCDLNFDTVANDFEKTAVCIWREIILIRYTLHHFKLDDNLIDEFIT